ncbi:hypothetical protein ACIRYZ_23030 [Kitasatospora sp. NPDC101155]|uniref:hypothetical protein n=1 Tax=Kitasatospora sp. NPDC101155 TaxID=3364097 RepID=UPI0037FE12DB
MVAGLLLIGLGVEQNLGGNHTATTLTDADVPVRGHLRYLGHALCLPRTRADKPTPDPPRPQPARHSPAPPWAAPEPPEARPAPDSPKCHHHPGGDQCSVSGAAHTQSSPVVSSVGSSAGSSCVTSLMSSPPPHDTHTARHVPDLKSGRSWHVPTLE